MWDFPEVARPGRHAACIVRDRPGQQKTPADRVVSVPTGSLGQASRRFGLSATLF
jgi:hypothetical protein